VPVEDRREFLTEVETYCDIRTDSELHAKMQTIRAAI
jgi:hypothetical protein